VVVDDAISWHATFVQNKSHYIPANWLPDIERLVKKLGFRLVLRSVSLDKTAAAGADISIVMKWENLGIAPPYRDHRIALRLKDKNGINHGVTITETSIQGWLPGKRDVDISYTIPAGLTEGDYELEMGVVFHSAIDHTIPIANKGKTSDGWYLIGEIKIK
jgi:uncharacterized membrane protein